MAESPFLTDAEIADLTYPLVQGKARCRYLERKYKVKVVPRPDGQPRVGREEFNAAMLSQGRQQVAPAGPNGNVVSVDFAAMAALRNKPKRRA